MAKLAPIVLFVYNRPWHTRQCLEALMKNDLADQSILYIYADGPKESANEEQLQRIKEVRQLLREKKWTREVNIIEAEKNKGLTNSIIEGITFQVNMHSRVIVLEDDIVISSGFLKYMNEALKIYEQEEKVFGISGYTYPTVSKDLPETYFLRMGSSWGWSTWKRAWDNLNFDVPDLIERLKTRENYKKFNVGGYPYFEMLLTQNKEFSDTWDIQWYASLFLANGFFLFPKKSLSKNIGFDNSGTHCDGDSYYETDLTDEIVIRRQDIVESSAARKGIEKSFSKARGSRIKIISIVKSKFSKLSKIAMNFNQYSL
jgi:GT2 family glycosyltransferase